MIDARLGPVQARLLAPLARLLHARGARADLLSVTGFGIGVLAAICLCLGLWTPALGLILLNRLFDGLDGAVARLAGATERGAFLDIALDFLFYALIPLGFAVQDPALNALPAAVLLASFIGTGSSFLAFAAIACGFCAAWTLIAFSAKTLGALGFIPALLCGFLFKWRMKYRILPD